MVYDIAVIGGGAAGLFAAIYAKQLNSSLNIVVLEALERVGKKLITTGNGQCNITNRYASVQFYHSETPKAIDSVLSAFSVDDTVKAFRKMGVEIVFEADGRAYPASYQAGAVVDALRFTAEELGVEIINGIKIDSFKKQDNYILTAENAGISAKKVIFACGLLSGGAKLGSFGDTIRMFKALGYETSKTTPAIVQLKTETDIVRQLKGIKVTGTATLKIGGKQICSKQDEILFTDYGLSGPAILGISREAARVNDTVVVSLDIMPNINAAELEKLLLSRKSDLAARSSENFLTGLINKRLGQVLLKSCHIPLNILSADIEDVQISHLANLIKNFTFTVTGNTGFNNSQVTAGGIKLTEVNINTLEARKHKGLYIIGELLDVDGDCGGFNLQWAWSSAAVAARGAAK